jgi:ferrous iron transport protein B
MNIALAGNPNCGKTTVYNILTGKRERVGNWAGVTVDIRSAYLRRRFCKKRDDIRVIDLPGTYSLKAYTKDEQQAIDFIKDQDIDVIINIVDASNLERNLLLTTELQALNIPMVIALNKSDIVRRRKTTIDIKRMKALLQTDVFFMTATKRNGIHDIITAAINKGEMFNHVQQTDTRFKKRTRFKRRRKKHCG